MADTLIRLSGPTLLTAAAATVYTVPAATVTSLRSIHVTNNSAAAATFWLSLGTDANNTRLFSGITVLPGDVLDWMGLIVLNAADFLQAYAGTTSVLALTMSGIQTA